MKKSSLKSDFQTSRNVFSSGLNFVIYTRNDKIEIGNEVIERGFHLWKAADRNSPCLFFHCSDNCRFVIPHGLNRSISPNIIPIIGVILFR